MTEDSIVSVQIFDNKKSTKKDRGFLGLLNLRVGDIVELQSGSG